MKNRPLGSPTEFIKGFALKTHGKVFHHFKSPTERDLEVSFSPTSSRGRGGSRKSDGKKQSGRERKRSGSMTDSHKVSGNCLATLRGENSCFFFLPLEGLIVKFGIKH